MRTPLVAVIALFSAGFALTSLRAEAAQRLIGQGRAEAAGRGLVGSLAPKLVLKTIDGDTIINIGSMSSERFSAGAVAYTASKAGITGVTGVLAVELASRGIRVNQINPGAVDTEGSRAIGAMSDEARAGHIARTPLGRVGTPADIASVTVFLASDAARWVTGECLAVSRSALARRPKQDAVSVGSEAAHHES